MEGVPSSSTEQASAEVSPPITLYVGDLHKDVTESELIAKFASVEAVRIVSIHICRANSQKSLGYAYVNFVCTADAQKALDTLNYELIRGIPMRIMWSQRNINLRQRAQGNIFVKNLDTTINSRILHNTFSSFGNILSCKVALDRDNKSKGYGFVQFENTEDADRAITEVQGMQLNEKIVHVERYISRADRLQQFAETPFCNIYIKNFSEDVTEQDLTETFQGIGKITSLAIMKDENQNSRGFGFIAFEDFNSARNAVTEFNGFELTEGKPLHVVRALTKRQRENELKKKFREYAEEMDRRHEGCNLYVKHLADNIVDDSDLHALFASFGTITSAKLMKENNRSRGFGFVCFSNAVSAEHALLNMHGLPLGPKALYVAVAQRREARTAHLNFSRQLQHFNTAQYTTNADQQYYIPANSFVVNRPGIASTQSVSNTIRQPQNQNVRRNRPSHNRRRTVASAPPTMPTPTVRQQVPSTSISDFPILNNKRQPQEMSVQEVRAPQLAREPLTNYAAAVANTAQQKQMAGERLYSIVNEIYPNVALKITGMILEMPLPEVIRLLDSLDTNSLRSKIDEAFAVLKTYKGKPK